MWETKVGLPQHTVRHYSVFVNLGWAALEIFLAMIGTRRWRFPLRLGAPPPKTP
jgi:hypothetical protein